MYRLDQVARARQGLTEHQLTIASFVAAGHTNRETAEALGLKEKTVEWNLSRIYRRLGLRSRTELAAAFARRAPGGSDRSGR
jgi:DNA-binding NarL/FixJ family response regulator